MTGPLALCLTLHVLGAPGAPEAPGPSLAARLSLDAPDVSGAPALSLGAPRLSLADAPGLAPEPLAPALPPAGVPTLRRGSLAAGWGGAAAGTLVGDSVAALTLLVLVQPGKWAFQGWVESAFRGRGSSSVLPFLLVAGIIGGAAVVWGAVPPSFALYGARRGLDVVPSPRTRTLTFLAHLAAGYAAWRIANPQTPGQAFTALFVGDLVALPLVAAGLTARDAQPETTRARPERDPALALGR